MCGNMVSEAVDDLTILVNVDHRLSFLFCFFFAGTLSVKYSNIC